RTAQPRRSFRPIGATSSSSRARCALVATVEPGFGVAGDNSRQHCPRTPRGCGVSSGQNPSSSFGDHWSSGTASRASVVRSVQPAFFLEPEVVIACTAITAPPEGVVRAGQCLFCGGVAMLIGTSPGRQGGPSNAEDASSALDRSGDRQ